MLQDITMPVTRLAARFQKVKSEKRAAFISFISAGDPDLELSQQILDGLPAVGADILEIGMPFSDPLADGDTIQAGNIRALKAGINLHKILDMVRAFRTKDQETPVVLMGYFNPIYAYDVERFVVDAKTAGVDGLIMPDLPPEEDAELCLPALKAGLNFIRFVTPTTDEARLSLILNQASGFLYYVSVAGVTGRQKAQTETVKAALDFIKKKTDLPIAVGFGITNPEEVRAMADIADAVIVGSAIVKTVEKNCVGHNGELQPKGVSQVLSFVQSLAKGCRHVG